MPGPITHILCASMFLSSCSHHWNVKDFIRGTAFPDIRYLGCIQRNQTHHKDASLHQIQQTTASFQAGLLFHSYVDDTYNHFMAARTIPIDSQTSYESTLFKCYIDYAFYHRSTSWNTICAYLRDPSLCAEEKNFSISPNDFARWYNLIADYCSQQPSGKTIAGFFSISNQTANSGNALSAIIANGSITYIANKAIARYSQDQTLNKYPDEFYRCIEMKLHEETIAEQSVFASIRAFFSSLLMRVKGVWST